MCYLQETHFSFKGTHTLVQSEKSEKYFKKIVTKILKKSRVAKLISDKIDFKVKRVKNEKEAYYIMMKGSIHQNDIITINIYEPNIVISKYVKQNQTELKGE